MLSPKKIVIEKFGTKEKLVDELTPILIRPESDTKEEYKTRLLKQSNKKLLKLHKSGLEVKEKFGSRSKLIDNIAETKAEKWGKSKKKLEKYSNIQLLNLVK